MPRRDADCDLEPCLNPPFYTLNIEGGGKVICDAEGRTLMLEYKREEFAEELCKVMNENKERLVKAWLRK